MSGILNSKERIVDTYITQEGRKNIAEGEGLKIAFVGFSDSSTFYQGDIASGSDDTRMRVFLEASSKYQDQVSFESDRSGIIKEFETQGFQIIGDKITSGSISYITGAGEFVLAAESILKSSPEHFKQLRLIGTQEPFSDSKEFRLNRESGEFIINDLFRKFTRVPEDLDIDHSESFYADRKLSHIENFKFLPPINKLSETGGEMIMINSYNKSYKQEDILTYGQMKKSLSEKYKIPFKFLETSKSNNVSIQVFERRNDSLRKLDVIDFGTFVGEDVIDRLNKRVFFVGKIMEDDNKENTFINIFTIIME